MMPARDCLYSRIPGRDPPERCRTLSAIALKLSVRPDANTLDGQAWVPSNICLNPPPARMQPAPEPAKNMSKTLLQCESATHRGQARDQVDGQQLAVGRRDARGRMAPYQADHCGYELRAVIVRLLGALQQRIVQGYGMAARVTIAAQP